MNGGLLPVALLCATIGLALSFVPPRIGWVGLAAMLVAAAAMALAPLHLANAEPIFLGLWLTIIVTAASTYLPRRFADRFMIAAGANAGLWIGLLTTASTTRDNYLLALPLGLLMVPARWFILRNYHIVIRVAASWLIAIAALSILVSLMPTPGYEPDHMG